MHRAAHRLRKDTPVVRLGPRYVDEVGDRLIRGAIADESRGQVVVIVVEEDRGPGLALEFGDDHLRDAPVDSRVALCPGVVDPCVDVRCVREPPEVVLDEPQDRVGNHVVIEVVRLGIVGDEPQPVRRPVGRVLHDRLAMRFLRHLMILWAHRARDPRDVVMAEEPSERGHEPAAAPSEHALALLVRGERDRPAVGNHDELAPAAHALRVPADRVSRRFRKRRARRRRRRCRSGG